MPSTRLSIHTSTLNPCPHDRAIYRNSKSLMNSIDGSFAIRKTNHLLRRQVARWALVLRANGVSTGDHCPQTRGVGDRLTARTATAPDGIEVLHVTVVIMRPRITAMVPEIHVTNLILEIETETTLAILARRQMDTLDDLHHLPKAFRHDHLHLETIPIETSIIKHLPSGTMVAGHLLLASLQIPTTAVLRLIEVVNVTRLSQNTRAVPTRVADLATTLTTSAIRQAGAAIVNISSPSTMRMGRLIAMVVAGVAQENTTSYLCGMTIALHHREGVPTITMKARLAIMILPLVEVVWKMHLMHTTGVGVVVLEEAVTGTDHLETTIATATGIETMSAGETTGARGANASAGTSTEHRSSRTLDFLLLFLSTKSIADHGDRDRRRRLSFALGISVFLVRLDLLFEPRRWGCCKRDPCIRYFFSPFFPPSYDNDAS